VPIRKVAPIRIAKDPANPTLRKRIAQPIALIILTLLAPAVASVRTALRPHRCIHLRWPFFSSWDKTEAASIFASVLVGFLSPLRIFEAKVDTLLEDCFFGIRKSPE
jgi:hypothetical protein